MWWFRIFSQQGNCYIKKIHKKTQRFYMLSFFNGCAFSKSAKIPCWRYKSANTPYTGWKILFVVFRFKFISAFWILNGSVIYFWSSWHKVLFGYKIGHLVIFSRKSDPISKNFKFGKKWQKFLTIFAEIHFAAYLSLNLYSN